MSKNQSLPNTIKITKLPYKGLRDVIESDLLHLKDGSNGIIAMKKKKKNKSRRKLATLLKPPFFFVSGIVNGGV